MDISLKQAPLDPTAWSDRELHAFARGYLGLEDGDTTSRPSCAATTMPWRRCTSLSEPWSAWTTRHATPSDVGSSWS